MKPSQNALRGVFHLASNSVIGNQQESKLFDNMDASSFRSTGIKMTIDNPDDFCSFKGKDIDFEDEKYDPFPVYRFKPVAMNMLKHCIVPSRLDNLVANLEYIGSRKMANVEELELAESTLSFFTNEFPRYWLKKGSEALLTSVPEILVSIDRTSVV